MSVETYPEFEDVGVLGRPFGCLGFILNTPEERFRGLILVISVVGSEIYFLGITQKLFDRFEPNFVLN